MTFATLEKRLVTAIRARIAKGEMTERRLAKQIGISQPHVHNVLKGLRSLTPKLADLLLAELNMSALELARQEELGNALEKLRIEGHGVHYVGIGVGKLGRKLPFPGLTEPKEWVRLPEEAIHGANRPVLIEFGDDEYRAHGGGNGRLGLVDICESARIRIDEDGLYVLRWSGAGYLRRLRRESSRIVVMGQGSLLDLAEPAEIPLEETGILQVVRGRLVKTGPDPRRPQFVTVEPAASA